MTDEAVASYHEQGPDRSVRLTLYVDRIDVHLKIQLSGESRHTIQLAELSPNIQRLRLRSRLFATSFWFLVLGPLAGAALGSIPGVSWSNDVVIGLKYGAPVLGIFLFVVGFRKARYVQFTNHHGVPILSFGDRGNSRKVFEAFSTAVQDAVNHANRGAA